MPEEIWSVCSFYIKLFKEEEYYQDEINIQDVLFIMWHHFQQSVYDKEALPPIFDSIGTAALGVFTILDNEYENAPSNERLLYILCDIDIDEEHFYDYRKILEWFHYDCYFNVGNKKRLLEATKKIRKSPRSTTMSCDIPLRWNNDGKPPQSPRPILCRMVG